MIFEVVLSKVLDNFLAFLQLVLGIKDADLFEKGFSHQIIFYGGSWNHLLNEGKDLDYLGVSFDLEESSGKHNRKFSKFNIV